MSGACWDRLSVWRQPSCNRTRSCSSSRVFANRCWPRFPFHRSPSARKMLPNHLWPAYPSLVATATRPTLCDGVLLMKIIHTADWHLCDSLGRIDRTNDLKTRVETVANLCEQHAADVLLIAGDLFSE